MTAHADFIEYIRFRGRKKDIPVSKFISKLGVMNYE